ncbi:Vacuole morphology and inheritance protein 14 [Vanrija pseudolonga]|uniref:Vacuole morphology and inheritance protein 14 n=1 Tax=Vanrija pseudolonga TaxID=143232 RepID=A0AAF0Y210_9TREE|nr:Vacuole morphology and inheritance protein 14 [Vanrija pseudolonga]
MDPSILRGLNDKIYERRKAAALELEKQVLSSDGARIATIVDQLVGMFSSTNAMHTRNGGLIGLAATAIALGQDVAPYLPTIIPPVLACFQDSESRVRYHACESLYNIAKVSKGEILVYFNEVFDALSKLSSDSEMSVKNGAELLDRLMKDIVADAASNYVSIYYEDDPNRTPRDKALGESHDGSGEPPSYSLTSGGKDTDGQSNTSPTRNGDFDRSNVQSPERMGPDRRAFSLERFIPLLNERVYAISPYTRMHLVSWLMVLNTVPDLELVTYLPDFLDGLLKFLADSNLDVRVATENLLAEFLREIKLIAQQQDKHADSHPARRDKNQSHQATIDSASASIPLHPEDNESAIESDDDDSSDLERDETGTMDTRAENEWEGDGSGAWEPGQNAFVDYSSIMDIIVDHLSYPDNMVQTTAMDWILTFLEFAQNTVIFYTPRIVSAVLPNLASPNRHIKAAASETNRRLTAVIQALPPLQVTPAPPAAAPPAAGNSIGQGSSTLISTAGSSPQAGPKKDVLAESPDRLSALTAADPLDSGGVPGATLKIKAPPPVPVSEPVTPATGEFPAGTKTVRTRPQSPVGQAQAPQLISMQLQQAPPAALLSPGQETFLEDDPFDVHETVNMLTLQFLSDHPETRIAALEWLLMLHLKAPTKILSRDSGTFPALLKTLSDPSEDVVKHDLQLLAQISSSSEDSYFRSFMVNVLELFSTDRRLLENRGSLIIRQLCIHLNAEKIFRTLAEILEKDDDLEFAGMMVVKLNMILITSPELADFRRRLKNLDSKDGSMLFTSLYRSWCHNAVAAFALCLLAQAYEHASNVLQIFAELELTVPLLVQIDKLVMLIESPVFTNLRLQLLEPEKYPYLSKCLYGLLMILPQSSAFVSLRARLSVVNSSGYVPPPNKPNYSANVGSGRTKVGEIKWQELLAREWRDVEVVEIVDLRLPGRPSPA